MASSAALLSLPHERGSRAYINKTPPFPEAFSIPIRLLMRLLNPCVVLFAIDGA
jgi:hypothetical protein